MKTAKKAAALAVLLALALSLAGCGTAMSDASALLVQGNLDEIYLGKFDPAFLELVDVTEAEAEENYEQGLGVEADYFMQYFQIEYPTDELRQEVVELYKDIYSHARYEVGEATKVDDTTYGVPVSVYPMDIMQKVSEQSEAAINELHQTYTQDVINADYEAYDHAWAEMIIGLCRDNLDSVGYLDPEDMVVQVTQNDSGVWTIYESDFSRVDAAIIYYP